MGFLDELLRPIATSTITEYGTSVAVTKVLRGFNKVTLEDTLTDSDTVNLPCTRRDFNVHEVLASGGKIINGDIRLTIPAESWEAALPSDPLPRTLGDEEVRCAIAEGDGTAIAYRLQGLGYGVAQASMAVYKLQLRRVA